ncbi:MAG: DUF4124 domain-containing protein [Giesbergeria sp.]|jgi:hypothetical protein|nr:DUF4124 domain-containing protein [Giesbergeria sp.]
MLSPRQRTFWTLLAVLLLAAAVAAWWTRDHWADRVQPWAEQAWRKATRPGADTLPQDRKATPGAAASAPVAPTPRKCLQAGRTIYTDQPCPPGSQEQLLEGGAVTTLPR